MRTRPQKCGLSYTRDAAQPRPKLQGPGYLARNQHEIRTASLVLKFELSKIEGMLAQLSSPHTQQEDSDSTECVCEREGRCSFKAQSFAVSSASVEFRTLAARRQRQSNPAQGSAPLNPSSSIEARRCHYRFTTNIVTYSSRWLPLTFPRGER